MLERVGRCFEVYSVQVVSEPFTLMADGGHKRRSVRDFVKMNSFAQVDPARVAGLAAVGLFTGAVIGVLSQIAKLDFTGEGDLDPPAPNMQQLEPELIILYRKFMGPFYKLCPDRNKKKFQFQIRKAIKHAEAVMLVENQLLKNEIARVPENRTQTAVHSLISMQV